MLSTFDLNFREKELKNYQNQFGKENIVMIKKSKLFLWIKIILPTIWWGIALIAMFILIYSTIKGTIYLYWISGLVGALRFFQNFVIIRKYLDYKVDCIIISPNSLTRYDQTGFLERTSKIIELHNLKTVSIRKNGLLNSLFNNGDLLFLSEGGLAQDEKANLGEIIFRYIYNPEKYKQEINRLLDINSKGGVKTKQN